MTEESQGIVIALFCRINVAVTHIAMFGQEVIHAGNASVIYFSEVAGFGNGCLTPVNRIHVLMMLIQIAGHDVPGNEILAGTFQPGISIGILELREHGHVHDLEYFFQPPGGCQLIAILSGSDFRRLSGTA